MEQEQERERAFRGKLLKSIEEDLREVVEDGRSTKWNREVTRILMEAHDALANDHHNVLTTLARLGPGPEGEQPLPKQRWHAGLMRLIATTELAVNASNARDELFDSATHRGAVRDAFAAGDTLVAIAPERHVPESKDMVRRSQVKICSFLLNETFHRVAKHYTEAQQQLERAAASKERQAFLIEAHNQERARLADTLLFILGMVNAHRVQLSVKCLRCLLESTSPLRDAMAAQFMKGHFEVTMEYARGLLDVGRILPVEVLPSADVTRRMMMRDAQFNFALAGPYAALRDSLGWKVSVMARFGSKVPEMPSDAAQGDAAWPIIVNFLDQWVKAVSATTEWMPSEQPFHLLVLSLALDPIGLLSQQNNRLAQAAYPHVVARLTRKDAPPTADLERALGQPLPQARQRAVDILTWAFHIRRTLKRPLQTQGQIFNRFRTCHHEIRLLVSNNVLYYPDLATVRPDVFDFVVQPAWFLLNAFSAEYAPDIIKVADNGMVPKPNVCDAMWGYFSNTTRIFPRILAALAATDAEDAALDRIAASASFDCAGPVRVARSWPHRCSLRTLCALRHGAMRGAVTGEEVARALESTGEVVDEARANAVCDTLQRLQASTAAEGIFALLDARDVAWKSLSVACEVALRRMPAEIPRSDADAAALMKRLSPVTEGALEAQLAALIDLRTVLSAVEVIITSGLGAFPTYDPDPKAGPDIVEDSELLLLSQVAERILLARDPTAAAAPAARAEGGERVCANGCGHPGQKLCSRCHVVRYCSRECQTAHWKEHKTVCCSK